MPLTYHVHKHLLRKDNQLMLVTEREWGFATLTGDDLQEFTRDMQDVDVIEQNMHDTCNGSSRVCMAKCTIWSATMMYVKTCDALSRTQRALS